MGYGNATELKSHLQALLDENDRIDSVITVEGEGVQVKAEDAARYRKNLKDAQEIRAVLADMEATDELKSFLADGGSRSAAQAAAAAAAEQQVQLVAQVKQLGELFTESDEFKALIASGGDRMPAPFSIEGKSVPSLLRVGGGVEVKDVYAGSGSGRGDDWANHGFGRVQFDPMVPRQMRRARVRDLFPVAQTNANLIDFFRVIGFGTDRLDLSSSASMVPDYESGNFGLKPQSNLTFESAQAPVRTIAHYELAHRNVLQDEPQLQSTINNELLYGLRLTEDDQILNGTGTGEDLLGILNTPGIQTYGKTANSGPSSDGKQDTLRRAATRAILAYFDPTGIVTHPYDWEDIELTKSASDDHYMVTTNVTIGAESRLWRMTVVDSPAIAEGTALVGAFGLGAQLYDRMQANVRIAEQHADLFVRNAVAILAEERLALAVKRPESFVKVTYA